MTVFDTPVASFPAVTWHRICECIADKKGPEQDVDLERVLKLNRDAETFIRIPERSQKVWLKDVLGDASELIEVMMNAIQEVSNIFSPKLKFC